MSQRADGKVQYIASFISDWQPCCFQRFAVCIFKKLSDSVYRSVAFRLAL